MACRVKKEMSQPIAQLVAHLAAQLTAKGLDPTPIWLTSFLANQRPTPLPALTQTALFRLLASDITTTLTFTPTTIFPADVHTPQLKERRLIGPLIVQVLAVEDISLSRWEQIEAIEALEKGEGTRGREILRAVAPEEGAEDFINKGGGPHKLLLQDAHGERVFGIELKNVEGVGLGMSIGCKAVLRNITVARGVVLLEPRSMTLLGGRINALHQAWKENRKAELKVAIEARERA